MRSKLVTIQCFFQAYVDDYLEDLKYDLTPKTYKSRKKPLWVIRELMERDNQVRALYRVYTSVH